MQCLGLSQAVGLGGGGDRVRTSWIMNARSQIDPFVVSVKGLYSETAVNLVICAVVWVNDVVFVSVTFLVLLSAAVCCCLLLSVPKTQQ